jgi:hypothetical protein
LIEQDFSEPTVKLRSETNWREMADRGLEIVICVGHIFGVIMLIAEHLL